MIRVLIEGKLVRAIAPEGFEVQMPVERLVECLTAASRSTRDVVLREGSATIQARDGTAVVIHETPHRVWNFKWIDENSPAPYGPTARYRQVRLALPHVIVFAVFDINRRGVYQLSRVNECYFSNAPLKSFGQELYYPALLNCSNVRSPDGRRLSWICTEHLECVPQRANDDVNARVQGALKALLRCLFETGFNYSSEHHEGRSWFSESKRVDPRIASAKAWEKATNKDPYFVLEIPWLPTGMTAAQIREAIFMSRGCGDNTVKSADDIARHVLNDARR
jgi:hypothetical protein